MYSFSKSWIAKIPAIRDLAAVRKEAHKSAAKQVSIGLVLSTLPIWLTGTISWVLAKASSSNCPGHEAFRRLAECVSQGELFMLAVATVAPLFYLESQLSGSSGGSMIPGGGARGEWPFPFRDLHRFFISLFILVASVLYFSTRRDNLTASGIVVELSIFFYAISLLLLYAATAQTEDKSRFAPMQYASDEADAFVDQYAQHRGAPK